MDLPLPADFAGAGNARSDPRNSRKFLLRTNSPLAVTQTHSLTVRFSPDDFFCYASASATAVDGDIMLSSCQSVPLLGT